MEGVGQPGRTGLGGKQRRIEISSNSCDERQPKSGERRQSPDEQQPKSGERRQSPESLRALGAGAVAVLWTTASAQEAAGPAPLLGVVPPSTSTQFSE